ncbi:DinB family protein [Flavobacteriaceae bacterium F89]|uniref:DinB family protein n=1 Tax=Cerina litoralis TaxID=2874477 RepID=A0AAE3ETF5_9FLAO|nr:DinB family protein [Cerina litoralis]MCG2459262.1 DinB family protein [Cerina litoralis]
MTNKDFFVQTWESEMQITLNAVNALPKDMDKLNYRCDEKARSAAEIIGHMLPHAEAICNATKTFVADEKTERKYSSVAEAAGYFKKNASQLVKNLKGVDEKTWEEQIVEFHHNGHKLFAYPMSAIFWIALFDIIHHRGQLSTYYRHMGVRNPNIYGPTAEDMEEMMAKQQ